MNECVSNKTSKLISEGYEQSQAQAIAIHMCEKSMTPDEEAIWLRNYGDYFPRVKDYERTMLLADGALRRANMALAVKANGGKVYVEGWALLFSDAERLDLQNTYFPPDTETLLEYYKGAPLFWEHTKGDMPIGRRSAHTFYPGVGIWLEHELDPSHPRYKQTLVDIEAGRLSYSTDSMSHYVEEGYDPSDGELAVWPLAGCSLTRQPAEPGLSRVRIRQDATAGRSASLTEDDPVSEIEDRTAAPPGKGLPDAARNETELNHQTNGEKNMDKEQLRLALVTALNLAPETTLEEIVAMLQQAIGEETSEASAEMSAVPQIDMASVRSAIPNLPADADEEAVIEAIKGVIAFATAPDAIVVNQEAMARVFEMAAEARKSAPVLETAGGYATTSGSKSSARYGSVNVNRGAPAPSLGRAIKALLAGDRKEIAANTKAQGATENVLGGYFLRDEVSAEILKPVYNQSSIMQAGVTQRSMTTETLTVRKNRGGSVAYWAGEHQTVSQSDITIGQVDLVLKELVAENRQSRKALTYAEGLEQEIRDDLSMQMALALDLSALRGTGAKPAGSGHSGAEPLGVRNTIASSQVTTLGSGNGAAPALSNLNKAIHNIKARNFRSSNRWGWITSTRESQFLSGLTTTTGEPLLRENWAGEMYERVLGIPKYESNQVPTNLTTGTNSDCSEIYLGDWQYAAVGIGKDVELVVDESVYRRERDVLIQAVMYADFGIFFREAFEVLAGVRGIIT